MSVDQTPEMMILPPLQQDQSPPPEVTVIIISYNTRDLTLAALRTLYATTKTTRIHVVVFDNASADGSADAVAEAFPQVQLIRSAQNLGFARANNVVAKMAQTEWLLLLNPDTEVHEGAVDTLLAFGKAHPQAGIYGGRTVFRDGSLNTSSCWNRITPWSVFCSMTGLTALLRNTRVFNPEAIGGWKRDTEREVDIVVGCFLLIRRALWAELGGFDPRYFMYGEEADLCLRAAKMGYRPRITPQAEIMHIVGAASKARAEKLLPLIKARVTLIRDHWAAWKVPFGIAMMWAWGGLRYLAATLLALRGGDRNMERRALWAEVWAKRYDWLRGY